MFQNVSIGIVGKGTSFEVYDEDGTTEYLKLIEGEERRVPRAAPDDESRPSGEGAAPEVVPDVDNGDGDDGVPMDTE